VSTIWSNVELITGSDIGESISFPEAYVGKEEENPEDVIGTKEEDTDDDGPEYDEGAEVGPV